MNETPKTFRAFIAIDLPEAIGEALWDYQKVLKAKYTKLRITWMRREQLHLTLRFLGDITEEQYKTLNDTLKQGLASLKSIELMVGDPMLLPSKGNPRVMAVALANGEALHDLAHYAEQAAQQVGLEPETRAFKPHITLGRIREHHTKKMCLPEHSGLEDLELTVSEFHLYRSDTEKDPETGKQIVKHTLLNRYSLGRGS